MNVDLDAIKAPPVALATPDPITETELADATALAARAELADADRLTVEEYSNLDVQRQATALRDYKRHIEDRKIYIRRLFWLMVFWMAAVLLVIMATGMKTPTVTPAKQTWPWWIWLAVVEGLAVVSVGIWWPRTSGGKLKKPSAVQWPWWAILAAILIALVGLNIATTMITNGVIAGAEPSDPGWSPWEWVVAFELDNKVLLALIGGMTANVIGLFLVVTRHLYPPRSPAKKEKAT